MKVLIVEPKVGAKHVICYSNAKWDFDSKGIVVRNVLEIEQTNKNGYGVKITCVSENYMIITLHLSKSDYKELRVV